MNAEERERVEAGVRLALAELERLTGDVGFEPERFRERLAAMQALSAALAVLEEDERVRRERLQYRLRRRR